MSKLRWFEIVFFVVYFCIVTAISICTLQILQLCCFGFITVNDDAFQGLDSLTYLSLHSNNLTVAPSLQHTRHIEVLHLYDNMITNLSMNYFVGCDNLKRLYLQSNNLISLPDMTHVANNMQMVALDANRLMDMDTFERISWPQL